MRDGRPYKCSCSVFALNVTYLLAPHVPLCSRQVEELKTMYYPDESPPSVDGQQEVCVEIKKKDMKLQAEWGNLRLVSPIDNIVAMLRACVRDIKNDTHCEVWRRCLRALPMTFMFFEDTEAAFMHSVTIRQQAMQSGISLQRTPLQWAIELVAFRDSMPPAKTGKLPCAATVAAKFQGIRFSTNAEPPTKTFIDNVLTIHTRMLLVPAIKAALQTADEMFDADSTPFRKVNSLHIICCKAHTPERILFAVTMIVRLVKTKIWGASDVGTRKLKGMDGVVSAVEYLNMVKDIKDRLLNEHIYQFG